MPTCCAAWSCRSRSDTGLVKRYTGLTIEIENFELMDSSACGCCGGSLFNHQLASSRKQCVGLVPAIMLVLAFSIASYHSGNGYAVPTDRTDWLALPHHREAGRRRYGLSYSAHAMRAGFELYRAFEQDAEDNREALRRNGKLTIPVLAIGGAINSGALLEEMAHEVEEKVTAIRIPATAHWIPEEDPTSLVSAILKFLALSG
jgi:pimeloyl-ACP methyl ester carboxylesterase